MNKIKRENVSTYATFFLNSKTAFTITNQLEKDAPNLNALDRKLM